VLENPSRQQRINRLLFACVEELAVENARFVRRSTGRAARRRRGRRQMKLACVIHRFGPDIAGGSGGPLPGGGAEAPADRHDVTSSRAARAITPDLAQRISAGTVDVGPCTYPLSVRAAFAHAIRRDQQSVFAGGSPEAEQEEWFRENGPGSRACRLSARARFSFDRILVLGPYRYFHASSVFPRRASE
jgi:hypothetical protein